MVQTSVVAPDGDVAMAVAIVARIAIHMGTSMLKIWVSLNPEPWATWKDGQFQKGCFAILLFCWRQQTVPRWVIAVGFLLSVGV